MARPLRIEFSGALYHITARGNERKDIFVDDMDRRRFLDTLTDAGDRFDWLCHAYCLMSNHYHLLVETGSATLSRGMRHLNGVYTQAFNRRHRRVGHLFQGRFTGILVEKEPYLLELARYIILNPVRARMVHTAAEWPWSSYQATAALAAPHPCLTRDWILAAFGTQLREASRRYRDFVSEGANQPAPWENLKNQVYLGSESFIEAAQLEIEKNQILEDIPRPQRLRSPKPLSHYRDTFASRDEALTRAWRDGHYSQREIATYFGVSPATVSRAVKRLS